MITFRKLKLVKVMITTGCLLNYRYLKKYYKLIATDLNKEQNLNDDPKAIQQINFPGNLAEDNATMLYIHEEANKKKEKKRFFYKQP